MKQSGVSNPGLLQSRRLSSAGHFGPAPPPLNDADVERMVESTQDFTGADLKRTFEDGKALYAFDRVAGKRMKGVTDYFLTAAATVRVSKEKYAAAASRANAARHS